MTWRFHVLASPERRLFSRILQVLESQMVSIHSFDGKTNSEEASVIVQCSHEDDKSLRIEALLYRLAGIRTVAIETDDGAGR